MDQDFSDRQSDRPDQRRYARRDGAGRIGVLACCPRSERPHYARASARLSWPNGATSLLFSAEEPDRLRGKQHMKLWCDELAAWRHADAFEQALLGLRLGHSPQVVITTTPRPIKIIKQLLEDQDAVVTRGATFDNADHLAQAFLKKITARFEGRAIGRQELFAELLEETPGALWTRELIERHRIAGSAAPGDYAEIVVAVDPCAARKERSRARALRVVRCSSAPPVRSSASSARTSNSAPGISIKGNSPGS